jgi:hypothetical protein
MAIYPVDPDDVVDAILPAGGVSIHREHTLHSAGPNYSDRTRRSLILEFAPPVNPIDTMRLAITRAKVARVRRQLKPPILGDRSSSGCVS